MKSFFGSIVNELRERRLWPVALALVAGLIAVPLFLSKSAHPASVAQSPAGGLPVSGVSGPPVSVAGAPAQSRLTGRSHDPFAQQKVASAPQVGSGGTTSSAATATAAGGTATATGSGGASGSSGSSGSTGSSSSSSGGGAAASGSTTSGAATPAPAARIPLGKPKPAPAGLSATQSYRVSLSITNSAGGVDTIDPLERLSVLPSNRQPLLVELGVLKGGSRVLFMVQPGTVVSGPGTCTPGPIDCEILSLGQDQIEHLSTQSAACAVPVALFAVTGISVENHGSAAAAQQARREASAFGRHLLGSSTLSAVSLFTYEPSLGAVVDLRNLTVGGS